MNVRDRIQLLLGSDTRGALWCAAILAASVQHLAPRGPSCIGGGLSMVMSVAQGVSLPVAPLRSCAARAASYALRLEGELVQRSAVLAAANAAYAAADLGDGATQEAYSHLMAVASKIEATHVSGMADLIHHQTTPITPTEGRHPLWDWVAESHPVPTRVGSLGDALVRARRWRLRWWVPSERACAERLATIPPLFLFGA